MPGGQAPAIGAARIDVGDVQRAVRAHPATLGLRLAVQSPCSRPRGISTRDGHQRVMMIDVFP